MPQLGALETRVLDVLWGAHGAPLAVRHVHEALADLDLAYTTVMTVLDRLAKKGLVMRSREGKAWLYVPARSHEQLLADEVLACLRDPSADQDVLLEALGAELTVVERERLLAVLAAVPVGPGS